MKLNTVLPYQFHNLIMIFVTILTLLWCFKAIKRFYYTLRIRCAILSDRVIQIRGLSSYLSYFEGATRTHIDAVVHTRQSMPPVCMKSSNVPALINKLSITPKDANTQYQIEIDLSASVKSLVVLIFDFNTNNFQQMLSKFQAQQQNRNIDERYFKMLTGINMKSLLTSESRSKKFPLFEQNTISHLDCLYDEVDVGGATLKINLPNDINNIIREKIVSRSNNLSDNKIEVVVMIFPIIHTLSKFTLSPKNNNNGNFGLRSKYEELSTETIKWDSSTGLDIVEAGVNDEELRSTGLNDLKDLDRSNFTSDNINDKAAVDHVVAFYMHSLTLPNQSNLNILNNLSTTPSELIIVDKKFNMYNSLEIFGLAQVTNLIGDDIVIRNDKNLNSINSAQVMSPENLANSSIIVNSQSMVCTGGVLNTQEECVVCLTELKDVLLLPCRHLCVCNSCLIYIDKCPVCRSSFEEYIVLQKSESS